MKTLKIYAFTIGMMLVTGTSCKKYEEGPSLSLLTKKARLTGEWTISEYTINNVSQDLSGWGMKVTFNKDNSYKLTYTAGGLSISDNGVWEFTNDKESLKTTINGTSNETEIIKLKNNELKLRDTEGSVTSIYTYTK